jgi:hypothetical protein
MYRMTVSASVSFWSNQDENSGLLSPLKARPLKASPLKARPLKASPLSVSVGGLELLPLAGGLFLAFRGFVHRATGHGGEQQQHRGASTDGGLHTLPPCGGRMVSETGPGTKCRHSSNSCKAYSSLRR